MKKICLHALTLLFACFITSLQAQSQDDMKKWMDYMTPGEMHKMMASWDGTWNGEVTMWMAPGTQPSVNKSVAINKMIMGGRYQEGTTKGDFNGMPFEGKSLLAYDNAKKVFISLWIDNMGTGVMKGEGPWDPVNKSVTITGRMVDPMSGKDLDFREIFTIIDDDNQLLEMFNTGPDGKEYKSMSLKYARVK